MVGLNSIASLTSTLIGLDWDWIGLGRDFQRSPARVVAKHWEESSAR